MSEPIRVSYDVKDLLDRIDGRLANIDSKLDAKADIQAVLALQAKIEKLEKWREERETIERSNAATFTRREKLLTLFFAATAVLWQPIQQHFFH